MVALLLDPKTLEALKPSDSLGKEILATFEDANRLYERGDFGGALTACNRVIELAPDVPEAHCNLGVVLARLGRHEEALTAYDRALDLRPECQGAHYNQGVAFGRLGRHEEAVNAFDRALRLDSHFRQAHHNRGVALLALGRLGEAQAAVEQALKLAPDDEDAKKLRRGILDAMLRRLVRSGFASWAGGKPKGSDPPIEITPGPPISDYVIEDRR
jgi:Flp pilus assembly protein TadD